MKKKKIVWNYAVVRSIFGDFWVGKTKLKSDERNIFSNLEDARGKAEMLFEDTHVDFDPSDEESEAYMDYEKIRTDEPEEIRKDMEQHIYKDLSSHRINGKDL